VSDGRECVIVLLFVMAIDRRRLIIGLIGFPGARSLITAMRTAVHNNKYAVGLWRAAPVLHTATAAAAATLHADPPSPRAASRETRHDRSTVRRAMSTYVAYIAFIAIALHAHTGKRRTYMYVYVYALGWTLTSLELLNVSVFHRFELYGSLDSAISYNFLTDDLSYYCLFFMVHFFHLNQFKIHNITCSTPRVQPNQRPDVDDFSILLFFRNITMLS